MNQQAVPTPAALYARVSSDRQDVDLSVAAQLRALRDYAEKNGYVVAREYIDEAESGRIADRPQFSRMLDEASRADAPFQEILVWKFSRFTRKREHAVAFKSMLRKRGIRVTSITEHADDSPTGKLMEAIIESLDEFYSENLAQEVLRGMREAASRGFWVSTYAPYGYRKVPVQDGAKKRPKLELDPPADGVVRRIFQMALLGTSTLDITKALNKEGLASPQRGRWTKTTIHRILTNETYTGTLVWGSRAKDNVPPVRVEDAFPAIVSHQDLHRVAAILGSKAPSKVHPRRAASPYLLSGIVKCETCGKALTAHEAKSGQFTYYVCHSLLKRGQGACDTPRLNSKRFERMIIDNIRENILTESNIRELVKLVNEELDSVVREQREKAEAVEEELNEIRRRLDRLWQAVETTDLEINDILPRIREHKERQEKLEIAADEAKAILAVRMQGLGDEETIAAYVREMSDFLMESELTETRAFIRSFVKEIGVVPGKATIRYTIPMPKDSPIKGRDAQEIALSAPVLSTVTHGGPDWTKSRTEADSDVTPSWGIGIVYVRTASSSTISMPCTKLRMRAFRSGKVPSWRNSRKSATYPLISFVVGNSARRCSNWASASSRAAVSWSWRAFRDRMRGDSASMGNCLVSNAW